jgi:hypothetical protein
MEDWEKEFVTYDLASRMKALGFTESCFNLYHLNRRELMYVCPNIGEVATYKYDNHNKTNHISAPTFSQAFRWFRENYNLISSIDTIIYGCTLNEQEFHYKIITNTGVGSYGQFGTYEEAEFACLENLIEIAESK